MPVLPHGPSVGRWLPWGLGLAVGLCLGLVSRTLTACGSRCVASHLGGVGWGVCGVSLIHFLSLTSARRPGP